jgi:hypothetical protein
MNKKEFEEFLKQNPEEVMRIIVKAFKEKELLKIGNRSYVNAFKNPESYFDIKDLMPNGGSLQVLKSDMLQPLRDPSKTFTDQVLIPPSQLCFTLAGKYYSKSGLPETAGMIANGRDANTVIQSAINALTNSGKIFIKESIYPMTSSITLKPGVSIEGIYPLFSDVEPNPPGWTDDLIGGTVLVGDGTFDCFIGNKLKGVELKNLGIKNFRFGLNFGTTDTLGLALSELKNLYFKTITQRAIKITNLQHVRMDNIKGVDANGGLLHLINDHIWNGGNSVITDIFVHMPAGGSGIKIEAVKGWINLIEFHRPQVNFYGAGGGYGFHLIAPSDTARVICIDIHSLNVESMTGHTDFEAVRAEGRVQYCLFHIQYFAGTNAFDFQSLGGNTPTMNLLISPESVNLAGYTWDNIFVGTIGSGNALGIARTTELGAPYTTILAGDRRSYFFNWMAMLEPGRANTVKSATFRIDSTGLKTITIPHGLDYAPRKEDCQISVIEETDVDDWGYTLLKVDSTDATNVIVKIYVSVASATAGATARIALRVEKRV